MPESTIAQSILGTLGQIGGISGRRAQDGLTAAQAEEVAIRNKANKIILDDEENSRVLGELQAGGYVTVDSTTGAVTPNMDKLASDPQALEKLMGPEANRFLRTTTADGPAEVKFAGVHKLPGGAVPNQNPVDEQTGSLLAAPAAGAAPTQVPDRYVVQLRTKDGRTVPATQNASSAADDTLITLNADELTRKVQGRLDRLRVSGALDNIITTGGMYQDFQKMSDDYLKNELMKAGPDNITGGDPVASRGLYGIVDDLHGDDLMSAAKDAGVDIEKAKAAAAAKWATDQAKEREAVAKKVAVDPDEQFKYQTLKDLYSQQVERANKALADYDKTPAANEAAITAAMNAVGAAESKPRYMPDPSLGKANPKDPMGRSKTLADKAAKGDPARAKLVAARDEAMKALNGLKEPELKTFESGAPMPKFEWNEDNIRDAIRGKIGEQPTPEQTAALTKYAKDNGVQTAQDLAKLPSRNDALAVAWVIANNARGATPDRKVELFNTLANYARTGDSKKSPIDANVAITGARVAVAGAINDANQVAAMSAYRDAQGKIDWAKLGIEQAKLDHDMAKDVWAQLKDVDAGNNKIRGYMGEIYKGTLGTDNKIQAPTPEAMTAWKNLRNDVNQLPKGSPQQIAAQQSYLEGFFQMAAAESVKPGTAAWWDVPKIIANTFMREDGMVNMSPLIETAKIEYENGRPTRVSFTDHGATGKETKLVVGADEFKRFTGSSDFTTFVNAVHSQQAANLLQAAGEPVTPENLDKMIKGIRKSSGMDK